VVVLVIVLGVTNLTIQMIYHKEVVICLEMLGKKVELIRYKVTWQEDEQECKKIVYQKDIKTKLSKS
jgi:hypothetical protein